MNGLIVQHRGCLTNGVAHVSAQAAWADAQRILAEHGVDVSSVVEIDVGGFLTAGVCRSSHGALCVICTDQDRTELTAAEFGDRGAARAYLVRVMREVVGNTLRTRFNDAMREVG